MSGCFVVRGVVWCGSPFPSSSFPLLSSFPWWVCVWVRWVGWACVCVLGWESWSMLLHLNVVIGWNKLFMTWLRQQQRIYLLYKECLPSYYKSNKFCLFHQMCTNIWKEFIFLNSHIFQFNLFFYKLSKKKIIYLLNTFWYIIKHTYNT